MPPTDTRCRAISIGATSMAIRCPRFGERALCACVPRRPALHASLCRASRSDSNTSTNSSSVQLRKLQTVQLRLTPSVSRFSSRRRFASAAPVRGCIQLLAAIVSRLWRARLQRQRSRVPASKRHAPYRRHTSIRKSVGSDSNPLACGTTVDAGPESKLTTPFARRLQHSSRIHRLPYKVNDATDPCAGEHLRSIANRVATTPLNTVLVPVVSAAICNLPSGEPCVCPPSPSRCERGCAARTPARGARWPS